MNTEPTRDRAVRALMSRDRSKAWTDDMAFLREQGRRAGQ